MSATLWNILIYMAADNNLREECLYELNEIHRLGALSDIDVIAQFDSGDAMTRYDFRKLRALPVKAISDLDDLAEVLLSGRQSLRKVKDSQVISDFLEKQAGEVRNLVILSGHGSGTIGDFLQTDDPPNSLSIPALESALRPMFQRIGNNKVDILGMDSCLMSMVEVCYQLQPLVKTIIGAEGFELNTGWPYHVILSSLNSRPLISTGELAINIVKEYMAYYSIYYTTGVSIDMAACDLSDDKMKSLTSEVSNLALLLKNYFSRPQVRSAVVLAHWEAQSYKFEQYTDLWDFCNILKRSLESGILNIEELKSPSRLFDDWDKLSQQGEELKMLLEAAKEWEEIRKRIEDACRNVMAAIDNIVLISSYNGVAFQHSHGLSIYFPWSRAEFDKNIGRYRELAFAKATQWDEFLDSYTERTQREIRDDENLQEQKIPPLRMLPTGLGDVKINPDNETRINPDNETRINPDNETRGKLVFVPDIKNCPTGFYKDNLSKKFTEKISELLKSVTT